MLWQGSFPWGHTPWGRGGEVRVLVLPQILGLSPKNGQTEVAEDEPVRVQFYHEKSALDLTSITLYINDVLAYEGALGFQSGVVGHLSTQEDVVTLEVYPPQGFPYGHRSTVHAQVFDTGGQRATATWSFWVRDNPACYTGLYALPVEQALQRPLGTFLALEQLRTLFFQAVLQSPAGRVANRENKAARAIYQLAFATELATLQNPFGLRDAQALEAMVCEKQNTLLIDAALGEHRERIIESIEAFRKLGVLGEDYLHSFYDYLASPLYLYRVSLIANMILFAAAYEQRAA